MQKQIATKYLNIGYIEYGKQNSTCVILLHGFPYDVNAYSEVGPLLAAHNYRVIVPYLRGYGTTTFISKDTIRSGQQAALGYDLISLMDSLKIERAILAGYDWGGRAACIVAALWPNRVIGLVTGGGYNIQQISAAQNPQLPEVEHRYWYQYYFHTERGRLGFLKYRTEFCRMLWNQWSPNWHFDDKTYNQTSKAFENNDFVEVVIHSYRHRFGLVAGDRNFEEIERQLGNLPKIEVPSIAIEGAGDGVTPLGSYTKLDHLFSSTFERRIIEIAGHNIPQENPQAFADAVIKMDIRT